MHKFSTVYKMALDYGWVSGNPFHMLKLRKDKTERAYLTIDELERLANKEFSSERLECMRDIFLFCCYTGLAYIDVKTLTTENLVQKADGKWWIVTLENGVPIESVSKMLGHTNVKTTQIYARITERKINLDMDQLSKKLDPQTGVYRMPESEYRTKKQLLP